MMRFSFWLLNLLLIFGFLGCSTVAQEKAAYIGQNLATIIIKFDTCTHTVVNNPNYQGVVDRLGLKNLPHYTRAQLSDEGFANDEEFSSLIKYHNETAICRQQLIMDYMTVDPGAIPILTEYWQAYDCVLVDLITRKVTFGEANKKHAALLSAFILKVHAHYSQVVRDLAAAHDGDMQQRPSAFLALSQWFQQQQMLMQNQQLINAVDRPVITNCYRVGNSVQCTSY
jgi:hypothetical protein